jgi:hypothetical protein
MIMRRITYRHAARRSADYQAAESDMSVEIELEEGELPKDAYQRARRFVRSNVAEDATEALEQYVAAAMQRERDKATAQRAANQRTVDAARATRTTA